MLSAIVHHRQGDFTLEATLAVASGGVTALFGRSGSGKTTLVNAIAGLIRPDRSRIVLDGAVLEDSGAKVRVPPHRRRIGYVFQEARLFPHLSVSGNLLFARRIGWEFSRGPAFDRVVALLGLEPLLHRRPAALSGGERQRVAIGRALLAEPRLLLLDEPLASLDPERREEILPWLERLRDELALPMVFVSHRLDEVARLATEMVVLDAGRVVAAGPVGSVLARGDLFPILGRFEAGGVLHATVAGHDETWQLTRLGTAGGTLTVPRLDLPVGHRLRVRIRARDVLLALQPPTGLSARSALAATVVGIAGDGPVVEVALSIGDGADTLSARLTRQAAAELELRSGRPVWAVIKATAVERRSLWPDGAELDL